MEESKDWGKKISKAMLAHPISILPNTLYTHYPRILDSIEENWGTENAIKHLDMLLLNERGLRAGFENEVYAELSELKNLHFLMYPPKNDPFYRGDQAPIATNTYDYQENDLIQFIPPSLKPKIDSEINKTELTFHAVENFDELNLFILKRKPCKQKIGELLLTLDLITQEQINKALEEQNKQQISTGKKILFGKVLEDLHLLVHEEIIHAIAYQMNIPIVNLSKFEASKNVWIKMNASLAKKYQAYPLAIINNTLFVGVENPFSYSYEQELSAGCGMRISLCCVSKIWLKEKLQMMAG